MTTPKESPMTEQANVTEFEREERYIVVKRKHLTPEQEKTLRLSLVGSGVPTVECVVVESDWPEYETVWSMIEARVTGKAPAQANVTDADVPVEELQNFQKRVGLKHTPTQITYHYRMAVSGVAREEFLSLGYQWSDKPHRLVYDLCCFIEEDAVSVAALQAENEKLRAGVTKSHRRTVAIIEAADLRDMDAVNNIACTIRDELAALSDGEG